MVCQLLRGCLWWVFFFTKWDRNETAVYLIMVDESWWVIFFKLMTCEQQLFWCSERLMGILNTENSAMGCTKTAGPLAASKWYMLRPYKRFFCEFWIWWIWIYIYMCVCIYIWALQDLMILTLGGFVLFVTEFTCSILKNTRYDFDSSMGFSRLLETASRNGG